MTIPVVETRKEYHDLWEFLQTTQYQKDLWLGIRWNNYGFYQWLNGNILGIQNWAMSEPRSQTGQRCVYASSDQKWRTTLCSNDKHVICFYKDGELFGPPPQFSTATDFFTAYNTCKDDGGRLPVILTSFDRNRLLSKHSETNFWLGLIEEKDQFVWITGEYLGYYDWIDGDRGTLVHVHINKTVHTYLTFHAPSDGKVNAESRRYFCQNKTTKTNEYIGLWGYNYFKLVERSIYTLASPLSQVIVRGRAHCAAVCSRDAHCLKYTVDGTICSTFGNLDYAVSGGGVPLYERMSVSQELYL
ncbi:hypothetical protein LOTGIDRAFT_169409 [Lottia gigantea]|uniref:C-type lectin domain-containing protein n=1 Tax=Lottia gigantea TaxID=225164 RepID=V3ZR53_LOTGI|nr:hypothetical protein LOTGIDRAFT_169409 [Lottia gigantea]ESO83346.1 hypothetical protein LOTGIDRAFT_169409 [Lottia gigantea]